MLKVGVIGLGVGEQHIEGFNAHPDAEVTHVCDFDAKKLQDVISRHSGLKILENADDLLMHRDLDIVSIATYDSFHHEQVCKAIKQQKHVFVEKPICLFRNHADEIYNLLNKNQNVKISSNLILRKSPRFIELKERIQKGLLGEIYYVEGDYNYGRLWKITEGWRSQEEFYSIVYGGGVHIVDLLMWLLDAKITEVKAFGSRKMTEGSSFKFNDTMVAVLSFENGVIGKISCNFSCVMPHFHKLSIYGSEATFENDVPDARWYASREKGPDLISTAYPGTHKGDLIYNFIESIKKNKESEVGKKDIFDTMAACFALEEATTTDCSVKVNYYK